MEFDSLFNAQLDTLKEEGNYRIFAELERQCGSFPKAKCHDAETPDQVTVWCSNDYLGMGQHPMVRQAQHTHQRILTAQRRKSPAIQCHPLNAK